MPFVRTRPSWRRLLAGGLVLAVASVGAVAAIPILFGSPQPMIRIQWGNISPVERTALEQRFRLAEPAAQAGGLWTYVPADTSSQMLRTIVKDPSVADTDGINRRTFAIAANPPLTPRRGGLVSVGPWMARGVRALAYLLAAAAALLFAAAITTLAVERRIHTAAPARLRRAFRPQPHLRSEALVRLGESSRKTATVAGFFLLAVAWRFLTFTGFSNDHYAHLAMAQQLLMGDRPIRDFADPGWPLMYILTAIGWLVAGKAMATEWAIATTGFAVGAACTVAAGYRLSGSLAIAASVTMVEIIVFPRTYSYPKVLMYGAAGWAMIALGARPSTFRLVLMAGIVATAFLFRHDHGAFIGVAAVVCLTMATRREGWRVTARRVSLLACTTTLFLLPWIVFVKVNGGVVAYLQRAFDFSSIEADATRLSAWPWFSASSPIVSSRNAETWLFWLFWALVMLCAIAAIRRLVNQQERWPGEGAAVVALAAMGALVNATFLRQSLQVRIPDAIVPAAMLGAWAIGLCWTGRWQRRAWQRALQTASVVVVIVSVLAAALVSGLASQIDDSGVNQGLSGIRAHASEVATRLRRPHSADASSRVVVALRPFFGYVLRCSTQLDRIVVTSDAPDIPVVAGRRFAGDGVVFGSTYSSSRYQDQTLERLRAEPPLFVLHVGGYDAFRERFHRIDTYVQMEYVHMADVDVEDGDTVRIFVHATREASGTDSHTGWPCFAGPD